MNRVNSLAAERVEEQREIMDYILEGNQRIIDCIQAVQTSIKGGEKPSYTPLARISYREKHKETLDMIQKPVPPRQRYQENLAQKPNQELEMIYEEICKLRAYAEGIQSEGIAGRRELDELIERIYQLQNRLYMMASK
jgi:hypothetical protein